MGIPTAEWWRGGRKIGDPGDAEFDPPGAGAPRTQGKPGPAVVAVDTGGTFTDLLVLAEGVLRKLKVPSTPRDPSRAVRNGIRALGLEPGSFVLLHGTTVATNALLERKGSRVGLVTNRGFEDVLQIGRQNRPQLYALVGHRKPPLVPREDTVGVAGRLDPRGAELDPLDPTEIDALADWGSDKDSIAVCFLHSYANDAHEEAVASALEGHGSVISVSSRLLPEFREFERISTTVVNAFVAPLVSGYLARLQEKSGADRVSIMGSAGGTFSVERACREPVHTVLSGPAGGVVGALNWGRQAGFEKVITFDMGGTSTDVSLCPGQALRTREFRIDEQPIAIPVLDIHTVGAGGGSIARLDTGGALKVGPESAGARPGPICYGGGGTSFTVTDAHVWLGRLPPTGFLGGITRLDRAAIEPVLAGLARRMGTSLETAAAGVLSVADSAMERALRVISVERGYDPRDFCLVAFGGAGGLHVAELATRIGTRFALVPPDPGLLSAYGMLVAPGTREVSKTVLRRADDDPRVLDDAFTQLRTRAVGSLRSEGYEEGEITVRQSVDARYAGQSFELQVDARDWEEAFHTAHEKRYGYARRDGIVEAVTLRAVASATAASIRVPGPAPTTQRKPETTTILKSTGSIKANVYARADLGTGARLAGPAIITEYSGTTWIPESWVCTITDTGSLFLENPARPGERAQ